MSRALRDYQDAAVTAGSAALAEHDAVQLHLACGTGKTFTALRLAEQAAPGAALLVVATPTLALVDQILREWRNDADQPFSALAVCSDDTAVDSLIHLEDLTAGATTDPAQVADWIRTTPGRRVLATTYLSAPVVAAALAKLDAAADLLVCDESHHVAGRTDRTIRAILDRDTFPARRRLHMTATPRLDLRPRGGRRPAAEVIGMDDEAVFGPVAARYSFAAAIADGWLCDYRVAVIGVSTAEALALLTDDHVDHVDAAGGTSLQVLAAQAALLRAHQLYGVRRAITFHPRIADAAAFGRTLRRTAEQLDPAAAARLTAGHVSGVMAPEQRRIALERLRHPPGDGWAVLANARCLSEGVDVPAVDCVTFAHPRWSTVDVVQAVGRALRRSRPDDPTEIATIVIPIVIDDQASAAELDPGDYRVVWDVVNALRAHDEDLGVALDTSRTHQNLDDGPGLPDKITIALPAGTAHHVLHQLTLRLVQQTTSDWWEWLGAARTYRDTHGDLLVPADYITDDGRRLGNWITLQRSRAVRVPGRRAALDELGMIWDTYDARWTDMFTRAQTYRARHGHLRVSKTTGDADKQLALWLQWQRRLHARGELRADRVDQLARLGALATGFAAGLAACDRYLAEHHDLDVPPTYVDADGFALGRWLAAQRYRGSLPGDTPRGSGARAPLTTGQRAELTRRGMRWASRRGTRGLTAPETAELLAAVAAGETRDEITARIHRLTEAGVHHRALGAALGVSAYSIARRLVDFRRTTPAGASPRRRSAAEAARRQTRTTQRLVTLTAAQRAALGDVADVAGWAARAHALIARDGLPVAAVARACGLSDGAARQRLRNYPAT